MFDSIDFFDTEIKEIQMEKYNVKLMNNKKGYLTSMFDKYKVI